MTSPILVNNTGSSPNFAASGSFTRPPAPLRLYPRVSTATRQPRDFRYSPIAIVAGVFPPPPAAIAPTETTGAGGPAAPRARACGGGRSGGGGGGGRPPPRPP